MRVVAKKTYRRVFLLSLLASVGLNLAGCKRSPAASENDREMSQQTQLRIVSLSPGITETIFALGKGHEVVGLSDYCAWKADKPQEPPRVGSAITPNYEAIARVQPTLIIASEVAGEQLKPLNRLAPTHSLPWLTLEELTQSVRILGDLIQAPSEARELANKINTQLSVSPPIDAPKILLALDYGDSGTNETWFIRRNSIHGAVLRAAGARNAVEKDISGPPKLSPEQLLALDPDAIIVLRSSAKDSQIEARSIEHFKRWTPLRAVQENRIRVLSIEGALSVGPSVLDLTSQLSKVVKEVMADQEKHKR